MYGGRSSWPGRTVQHEFGFDAGESPVDGAVTVAEEGLVRLHVLVDAVELVARVRGEQDDDQEAAADGVDEGFQIEEESGEESGAPVGAVFSADEIHQGVGLTLGETDVEKFRCPDLGGESSSPI